MLKVIAAYYMRSLPTKLAVILPDGSARITDLTPYRPVSESELSELPVFRNPAYRRTMLTDKMPEYLFRFYGFTKAEPNRR